MRTFFLAAAVLALSACADQTVEPTPLKAENEPAPSKSENATTGGEKDDAPVAPDSFLDPRPADDAPDGPMTTPAAACAKELTVVLTVGVPGLSKLKTNGCWKPIITDGAANKTFRKCSTSSFKVSNNAAAANWAYDDTNPTHASAKETAFFEACADGADGDGYVFMAYNSGWRVLTKPTVKALFAELYTSAPTDIDSHYATAARYTTNAQLKDRTDTYPMINFGPPASAKLEKKVGTETAKLCKTVKDGGYFGLYNASWAAGMEADDPRLLAVEAALDACTAKQPE